MDIIDIPENFVDTEEPSDAQLMQNFASSIRVGPSQQMSGRVFFQGKDWPLQSALEAERADYLHQARSRWLGYRNAFRSRKRAQERQLEEQREFEEKAANGFYVAALRELLVRVKAMYKSGCEITGEIEQVRIAKDKAAADTSTDITELQKSLTAATDRLNAFELRLKAQESEYKKELPALSEAVELAQRELYHRWLTVRKKLVQQTIQALRPIVTLNNDRETEAWIELNGNAVRSLDGAVGCPWNSLKITWSHDKSDALNLAEEVCARARQFDLYVNGATHRGYLQALEPRSAAS